MSPETLQHEADDSRAIIVFAKQPLPGQVKTRLQDTMSAENAAEFYAAMLQDTIDTVRTLSGVTPFIFYQQSSDAADYFRTLAPDMTSWEQTGDDLGMRMRAAFERVFAAGFNEAAIIGTDSPDLPPEHIYEAFALLEYEHTDVVFGPAKDGGYYLLALKRAWEELFTGLPWSSDSLLAESIERARDCCLGASLLPLWYDIDTAEDLNIPGLIDENSRATRTKTFITSRLQPDSQSP